jgi:putative isomerase
MLYATALLVLTAPFAVSQSAGKLADAPASVVASTLLTIPPRLKGHDEANHAQRARLKQLIGSADYEKIPARLQAVNKNIEQRGLHSFHGASGQLLTGYAYGEYYDWDLYFENVYLSYFGVGKYDFTNFKVFMGRQNPDGFISRTLGIANPRPTQMFKPFLAQIAVLGSQQNGNDYEWLRAKYYGQMQRFLNRWFAYDKDGNGLPTWNSSDASGMDNQFSRSGQLESYTDEGVDLACELYRELQAMEIIATALGKPADAAMYGRHAARLSKAINDVFWDEKDGFYYDRNEKTGQRILVKSVAGFFPLWAGVASPEQATRIVQEHLLNPHEFWLRYPIASYAKTEPDFREGANDPVTGACNWRGPAWIPTNYIIFHGLMQYGFNDAARQLANKTFKMAMDENSVTREYYDSDTGKGNGMNPFWGWSALAYVMPLDELAHYNPMDMHRRIEPLATELTGVTFKGTKAISGRPQPAP